jgi:ribosomal protein S18 acetylase RimI-like enzyme
MEIEIGPYETSQRDAVVALWHRCGLVRPANDPATDIGMKTAWQPDLLLVGTLDGVVVATAMAGYEGHRGWINYLAVDPDVQRHGVGREILDHAERRLADLGCVKVQLMVSTDNRRVVGFYEALGYTEEPVVAMGKRLSAPARPSILEPAFGDPER